MRLTNRSVNIVLIGCTALLVLALFIAQAVNREAQASVVSTGLVAMVMVGLFIAYWRGWEWARYVVVVLATLATGLALPEPFISREQTFAVLVAPILALILTDIWWVIGSVATIVVCLAARSGWAGQYTQSSTIILLIMLTAGIVLSRLMTDLAQKAAEANAEQAREALARTESQALDVARKADELARQNDEQHRLLELVATLETPVVILAEHTLLAPIIGHLDSRRAAMLTERMLHEVADRRARLVVLDIVGVPTVDTSVAQALIRTVQAVRLLGCDVTITGISATVAATMTSLGISLGNIHVARTPQEALEQYRAVALRA